MKPSAADNERGLLDTTSVEHKAYEIQQAISEGSDSFLYTEYRIVGVFMLGFSLVIFLLLGSTDKFSTEWKTDEKGILRAPALANGAFSMVSFLLGAATSTLCGYFGMKIATYANARTALEARKGLKPAFQAAFRSGAVMGFILTSSGLLVLYVTILGLRAYYKRDWEVGVGGHGSHTSARG